MIKKIDSDFDKCIICLENKPDSWEHIIPQSIGGRMKANILCKSCNSELGHTLVSKVRSDPSIRLAIKALKNKLPELFNKIENRQLDDATDIKDDKVKMRFSKGKLEVLNEQKTDGALILDTRKGIKDIERESKFALGWPPCCLRLYQNSPYQIRLTVCA